MALNRLFVMVCLGGTLVSVTVSLAVLRMVYDGRSTDKRLVQQIDDTHASLSGEIDARFDFAHDRLQILGDRIQALETVQTKLRIRIEQFAVRSENAAAQVEPRAEAPVLHSTRFLTIEDVAVEDLDRIDERAVLFEYNSDGSLSGLNLLTGEGDKPLEVTADNAEVVEMLMEVEVALRTSVSDYFRRKLDDKEYKFFTNAEQDQLTEYVRTLGRREIKQMGSGFAVVDMNEWDKTEPVMALLDQKRDLMSKLRIQHSVLWTIRDTV